MNSEEYKIYITSKDVLNFSTLNITLKEVFAAKKTELVFKLERILKENKIQKPELHANPTDNASDYFRIDLTPEDIDDIADLFYDLEVKYIGEDGETTPTCAFYASLADKWAALNSERIQ